MTANSFQRIERWDFKFPQAGQTNHDLANRLHTGARFLVQQCHDRAYPFSRKKKHFLKPQVVSKKLVKWLRWFQKNLSKSKILYKIKFLKDIFCLSKSWFSIQILKNDTFFETMLENEITLYYSNFDAKNRQFFVKNMCFSIKIKTRLQYFFLKNMFFTQSSSKICRNRVVRFWLQAKKMVFT